MKSRPSLGPPALRTASRIWRMLLAASAAWFAAFAASLPVHLLELVSVAAGDRRLVLDSTAYGLLVWGLLTLAISVAGLVIVLGPVATFFSARWVVRHPVWTVTMLPLLSLLALVAGFYHEYENEVGPYVTPPLYPAYSIFILVFSAVSSLVYLLLLRRGVKHIDDVHRQSSLDQPHLN